jgi:V8-like Glu-specific endopeptidase
MHFLKWGDVVLIVLKDSLHDITPLNISRNPIQPSDLLVHASYAGDRRYVLTGHFGCHITRRDQNRWFTDCDTQPASSGGPVFVQRDSHLELAIMVGVTREPSSVALPIMGWDETTAQQCE